MSLDALLPHVALAFLRTQGISLNYSVVSGKLNMVISRVDLLPFMTVHLFQPVNCSPSGSLFSSQVSLTTILSC